MKKLNMTKEAFEKSKYFTNKYGRLEYVSESGKLFKTNKGKILKFNESVEYDYSLVEDWIKRARTAVVDARVGLMDKRSKEILLDDAIECLDLLESAFNDSKNNLQGTKFHIDDFPGEQPTPVKQEAPQLNEGTESNPRFKCMEGRNEYSDEIREFRDDVVGALKKCYGDEYMVEPDMMDDKSVLVSDPYVGLDYKIDISVSDEVDM